MRATPGALLGISLSLATLSACHDGDTVTAPPPPLDVSGTWRGGVTSAQLQTPCAAPEPANVTVTFTDRNGHVTGTFAGACLEGATFDGRVQNQRLIGDTTLHGHYCAIPAGTDGQGSSSHLALAVRVHYATEFFGCGNGTLGATGTLHLDLAR